MNRKSDNLEALVADRKRQLIAEILEYKKNISRAGAAEGIHRITSRLSELSEILKAGESTRLSAAARLRLTEWIAR